VGPDHLVAYLASDRAAYLTAQEIEISGGLGLNTFTLGSA
jgi:hypothetical protein